MKEISQILIQMIQAGGKDQFPFVVICLIMAGMLGVIAFAMWLLYRLATRNSETKKKGTK
jgi:hypothetical protein